MGTFEELVAMVAARQDEKIVAFVHDTFFKKFEDLLIPEADRLVLRDQEQRLLRALREAGEQHPVKPVGMGAKRFKKYKRDRVALAVRSALLAIHKERQ